MMIPNSFLAVCLVAGLLIALAIVIAFRLAWWWVPLIGAGIAIAVPIAAMVVFYLLWAASGFH